MKAKQPLMHEEQTGSASQPIPQVTDQEQTIETLRRENVQLRAELAGIRSHKETDSSTSHWQEAMKQGIGYSNGQSSTSSIGAGRLLKQLSGISKERMKSGQIHNSSEFEYLPTPSDEEDQLEADFVRWGYCLVKDAMSLDQVQQQLDRLIAQAQAEKQIHKLIPTSRNARAELVNNLVLKGQVFRDAVEFKESAAQGGPLVDRLLTKIMGEGFGLGCAHGSIVHEGGGLQDLHIDQGMMPLPYPPFPFGSLIIWCYTEFDLANGATYVVPGSHRYSDGTTIFQEGADLLELVDGEPGLVAICAPPGTCIITDTRVLHGGGRRTAPGTRYAMRCHYNRHFVRALHEQSTANLHVPDDVYDLLSDRLKHMMGIQVNDQKPLGELSPQS